MKLERKCQKLEKEKYSVETKLKMSESAKLAWQKRKLDI